MAKDQPNERTQMLHSQTIFMQYDTDTHTRTHTYTHTH